MFLAYLTRGLASRCGGGHRAGDLAEDRADARRDSRHDPACGNCDKTRHQSILNEVLSPTIVPKSQLPNQVSNPFHVQPFLDGISVSISNLSRDGAIAKYR